jgi:alanyl-tRNA synthetase
MKSSKEIRNDFIRFFEERAHNFIASSPVVPQDDPTLLFTNAGMNQFKAIFLGDNPKGLKRAANSQKCMRVSGKHNDLEEVGRDHYHHTFFEMLGNWSFGDYYKKESIKWAWELLTQVWKLPKDRLFVTIHTGDDEAEKFWQTETDIEHYRIMRFGDKSNFWEMGETGPCGPCSEIHYDMGDLASQKATYADPIEGVNGQNARYRELWNLVFMQYNREKDGSLKPLPAKHVDTGMGFERIVSVVQGVGSNYDIDLFRTIIKQIEKLSNRKYDEGEAGTPYRVIADHIRSLVFAITDGAFPSNEGRGYVLRRLLRRAFRFGRELGFREPFLYKLVEVVISEMGEAFPEITQRRSFVEEVIKSEEERFGATLEQGIEKFNAMIDCASSKGTKTLAGADVFTLYDTYGFPMDLTRLMAFEKGFNVDEDGYTKYMEEQKTRARDARKGDDGLSPDGWTEIKAASGTEFVGYTNVSAKVKICKYKMVEEGDGVREYFVILDKTPFYAESGGQTGDTGSLTTASGIVINVLNTIKWNDLVIHKVLIPMSIPEKEFSQELTAQINTGLRMATRRNHSATHLLQAALRKVLGDHVQQSGSKVEPSGLRFDFTHFKGLTSVEIAAVEMQVNEWIMENVAVCTDVKNVDAAKAEGATALFGEKYGDKVRVVSMGGVSKELCGGTHVDTTGQIGAFHIMVETSISAGIRRIEAVTGKGVLSVLYSKEKTIDTLASQLKVASDKIVERVQALTDSNKVLEAQVKELSSAKAASTISAFFTEAKNRNSVMPWVVKNLGSVDKDTFAQLSDAVTDEIKNKQINDMVIVLGAIVDDKVLFSASAGSASVKKCGVHCGELVKAAAQKAGGNGGGSPLRAQAGGKDISRLSDALAAVNELLITREGTLK